MTNPTTPDGYRIDECRTCNAPIVWAETSNGKSMPVDAAPADDGNVLLYPRPGGGAYATVLSVADTALAIGGLFPDERTLRTSHFVTCPNAEEWRKR